MGTLDPKLRSQKALIALSSKMETPRRAAAIRACQLMSRGWTVLSLDQRNDDGMSSSEEEELDTCILEGKCENLTGISDDESTHASPSTSRVHADPRFKTYDDIDFGATIMPFRPARLPGPQVADRITRSGILNFTRPIDFFNLFFSDDVIMDLCETTNIYGYLHIMEKTTYAAPDGSWNDVTPEEMWRFIAMVLFMGIIRLPDLPRYYSQSTLYAGGWGRRFLSRNRLKAILGMLHVADPDAEVDGDKLSKVKPLISYMKNCCKAYYQPAEHVSIDERMVRFKGRSPIQQYMPKKPAKFGVKFWCLCDASNGYTVDFNVYTGKRDRPSSKGLAYDVATTLIESYRHQGYRLYSDNFFTSVTLASDMMEAGVHVCGTTLQTRRGFPQELKDGRWATQASRGEKRYIRKGNILCLQWKDNKPVCILSTMHTGHEYVSSERNSKDKDGHYRKIISKKPMAVHDYNLHMGGVDFSDQLIETYNTILKSQRWWKVIFYHFLDIAVVNSFILFTSWQRQHPDVEALERVQGYSQLHYREELIRQMADIADDEDIPTCAQQVVQRKHGQFHTQHVPENVGMRRNCRVCYIRLQREYKSVWRCKHPICNVHLCLTHGKNCFDVWHSPAFDGLRAGANVVVHN